MNKTTTSPDLTVLHALTVGDYQRWLRKQIRAFGRRFEVGNVQRSPVDMFLRDATGLDCFLLAGGEVDVYGTDCRCQEFVTEAMSLAYHIFDDDGHMIVTAGKALDASRNERADALLVPPSESEPVVAQVAGLPVAEMPASEPAADQAAEKPAIQLFNRRAVGEYVLWDALSSDGHTQYQVTLRDGHGVGCECGHHVHRAAHCKHMQAAERAEQVAEMPAQPQDQPVTVASALLGEPFAADLQQHVEDSIASGEFVDPFAGLTKDQRRAAYRAMYPDDFYFVA